MVKTIGDKQQSVHVTVNRWLGFNQWFLLSEVVSIILSNTSQKNGQKLGLDRVKTAAW